ncbi:MAG: glycosyltransferase 87 family protein [Thermoanaerobaculia bacterium]
MSAGFLHPESSSRKGSSRQASLALALPLLVLSICLALVSDLSHRLALALALLGLGFLWLAFAARRLETAARPGGAILLGSLLLRLPLLLLPLTLSDDALRYLWDGRVALAGRNPYALPPAAPELIPFRDEAWQRLPHTDVPTVYPPLSIAVFSIASRLPFPGWKPLLAWKLLATAADLGTCALLLRLARQRGLPEGRTAWYAWNPLVVLEVSGMGHVDALGVAATVAAVLALTRGKEVAAGVWAAAGALAKIVPVAALPMWTRQSGARLLGTAAVLIAAAVLPVIAATGGIPPGLLTYGLSWEFNGPVYEPLWRLMSAAGLAPALARGLEALERRTEMWYAWDWVYPYLYPQLLAKLLLAAGMAVAVQRSLRETDPVAGTGRLFGTLLLLSATVYPWYLLWVLPWAALLRQRAWLALSGLILLSYWSPLWPWVFLAIWVPFALLMIKGGGRP